ncbi:MAG: hypothetical protein ACREUT_00490, partial [Steroidobacteraceae bacterium]
SSLWITREQRAQRLLDSGRAAEAAQLFSDPRRRAYADALIGRDGEAAHLLAPLRDPRSQYNRGNALARSGNLIGALASYDAALEQTPKDRDIRHNRDLVAHEIESREQQRNGQGGGSQSQRSGRQGNQSQSSRNGRQGSGAQSSPDGRTGKSGASQAGQSPSTGGGSREQESEQAREDAQLAADLQRQQRKGGQNAGSDSQHSSGSKGSKGSKGSARGAETGGAARAGGPVTDELSWPPPKSEQALALEQWLRRIPEDPGGLLRRKFLIEHMERQEGAEQ